MDYNYGYGSYGRSHRAPFDITKLPDDRDIIMRPLDRPRYAAAQRSESYQTGKAVGAVVAVGVAFTILGYCFRRLCSD